jgi:hypothetical protein
MDSKYIRAPTRIKRQRDIVLHQHDLARAGEVSVRQGIENLRIVERGVAVCYLDVNRRGARLFG